MMKAIGIRGYGPAREGGKFVQVEVPKPTSASGHDVLVKVHAIALNPLDWKVRSGWFDPNPSAKFEAEPKVRC